MNTILVSKSLVLSHMQCPRRAWLEHRGEVQQQNGADAKMLQEQGERVHASARTLFPNALRIGSGLTLATAAEQTAEALANKTDELLEAGFVSGGLGVRVDVLKRDAAGVHIIEVKSGGSVKDDYLTDCAIQYACLKGCGINVATVQVMHPNCGAVLAKNSTGAEILVAESVTDAVHYKSMAVASWVADCQETLAGQEPRTAPGAQCSEPHDCPFSHHCGEVAENTDPDRIELLPSQSGPVADYVEQGMTKISELPDDAFVHERNALMREAILRKRAVVTEELANTIKGLPYPRHFVDFEAVATALPVFEGTRPYGAITFQFSTHRQDAPGGSLKHSEFLDTTGNDPRRGFAESLIEALGIAGPVIVFSAYEKTRLKELAVLFPDLQEALMGIVARLVDLLPLARRGYYHPGQLGSWSLKKIAPTLPKTDAAGEYADLGVADGMAAQAAYLAMIDKANVGVDREALRSEMLIYCATDTAGLHRFVCAIESAKADPAPAIHEKKPKRVKKSAGATLEAVAA